MQATVNLGLTHEARNELGLPEAWLRRAELMGAWDNFYPDSAFDPGSRLTAGNGCRWNRPRGMNRSTAMCGSIRSGCETMPAELRLNQ